MNKLKSNIFVIVSLFLLLVSFSGCFDSGTDSDNTSKIDSIDITNAKALMVTPRISNIGSIAVSLQRSTSSNVFVKILSDGSIEEVTIQDVNGNTVSGISPTNIYNATDTYMIIIIDRNPYLVNKSDGSAYDLSPIGNPVMLRANGGYDGEIRKSIYSDINGNIYYLNGGIVKKIDVSNPNFITAESYTPDIYSIGSTDDFCVDNSGNVLFTYEVNCIDYSKIKKTDGSLSSVQDDVDLAFTGYDGNIYYHPNNTGSSYATSILQKLTFDSDLNALYTDYGSALTLFSGQSYRWMYFADRIIIQNNTNKFEIYKDGGLPSCKTLDFLSNTNLKYLKCSYDYYYVATIDGSILKVDPANDDSYTTLIENDQYDYYKMTVTNDDTVIFNALRLSDSKKIIGQITSTGAVSIIDDTLVDDVIILEKVN